MAIRLPKPGTFEHLLTPVMVPVASLVRLSARPAGEPFYGRTGSGRFDAPHARSSAPPFGVCYAADSLETAFCESVLHENSAFDGAAHVIAATELARCRVVRFRRTLGSADLKLVDLTGDALKKLALNNDLSSAANYAGPQRWAAALHHCDASLEGIRYVSRQRNSHYAYALFERSTLSVASIHTLTEAELDLLVGSNVNLA